MDILFKTKKFMKQCNKYTLMVRAYGPRRSKLIQRRLDEMRAADSLEDLRYLPRIRCYELRGNRKGQLSVDLDHPYRLIFRPAHDPFPEKEEGGLDWSKVTLVEILKVDDTHE